MTMIDTVPQRTTIQTAPTPPAARPGLRGDYMKTSAPRLRKNFLASPSAA